MAKLNDTQLILLSTATLREDGSLLPLPETRADADDRAIKAIAVLIKRGLAEERETSDTASVHRTDGDVGFGVFISEAGTKAIDAGPAGTSATAPVAPKPERPEQMIEDRTVERLSKACPDHISPSPRYLGFEPL